MYKLISAVLFLSSSLYGQVVKGDFFKEITYKGEIYQKCRVTKVTPAYIEVMHSFGGDNFYIHLLEDDFRAKEFPNYDMKNAISFEQSEIEKEQRILDAQVKIIAQRREDMKRHKALMNNKLYSFQVKTHITKEVKTEKGMYRFKKRVTGVYLEMMKPDFYQNSGKKVFDYNYTISISNRTLAYSKSFSGTSKSISGARICPVGDKGMMKLFHDVIYHVDTKISVSGSVNFTNEKKDHMDVLRMQVKEL